MRGRLLALALAVMLAGPAGAPVQAQQAAQLAADSLRIESRDRLVAEGAVEVLFRGNRLRAARLVYTRGAGAAPDRLEVAGPVVLEDAAGRVLVVAEFAELTADLQDGVMRGARMVLDRRLQLAAATLEREGGRFTRLERGVASSCQVCAANPVPLWEIRAARVTHDAETRRLMFERASFRLRGRTVAVLPRLTMPDPTVRRASGFLAPEIRSTSRLGPGVEVPYFLTLGPHRDLTLTPRLHARNSATLGLRYRQAFRSGLLELEGAVTRDRLRPGEWRGFIGARGDFDVAPGTVAGLRLRLPSDVRYLDAYGFGEETLRSDTAFVEHVRRDALGRLRVTLFRDYREGAVNAALPNLVLEAEYARRFGALGGAGRVEVAALALERRASDPAGGLGRDLARVTARADWRRDWLLAGGVQAAVLAEVQADRWEIRQDDGFPGGVSRVSPAAGVELRWPLVRQSGRAVHLLEPVAQLVWARGSLPAVPVEDSRLVELDEGTLFQLDRGPGYDGREGGARANLGLVWTRHDPAGWRVTLAGGRVYRDRAEPGSRLSGLGGARSDWLAAARIDSGAGLSLAGRVLVDDGGASPKQELRLAWAGAGFELGGSYAHLAADPAEGRARRSTDLGLDGRLALGLNWTAEADLRYDLARREPGRAGIGARFRNECLRVDVSLSRRFASSTSVAARTEFGLRVDLIGFGDSPAGPARPCLR